MAYRTLDPNSKRMDQACEDFLDSLLRNKKNTDSHMWPKYVGMGLAFVLGNKMGAARGEPWARLSYLLGKYWIYPPGGSEGRAAANRVMNH